VCVCVCEKKWKKQVGRWHLFVGSQREVGAQSAVAIVTKQNDTRLLCSRVEHVEVRRVPSSVDRDTKVKVGQHTVVRVVDRLHARHMQPTARCTFAS